MSGLFASGRIVDLILALTAAEAAFVVLYHRRTGRGPKPAAFLGTLLSGACLLLALRGALAEAWWGWIALWLLAALVAHVSDLRRRW
jgi:hypothetical protein